MIEIELTHNPFTIETSLLINGTPATDKCFSPLFDSRVQKWAELFFEKLNELYPHEEFEINFTGLEIDFQDLYDAALQAKRKKGMSIRCRSNCINDSEDRLNKILALIQEAKENPLFKEKFEQNERIKSNLDQAFSRDFDVYVAGTMSAGKSTLINAMLGCELLPSANQATTATIAKIYDENTPVGKFKGERKDEDGNTLEASNEVTLETLEVWNKSSDTAEITLEGNISGIAKRDEIRVVLSDTPGINNSQDPKHEQVTMRYIKDSTKNPLILYLLNAQHLATNDDKNTLEIISRAMSEGGKQSKDRFIFVANKMDSFDPDKGEDVEKVLSDVRTYLSDNGIENPTIYPLCSNFAKQLRLKNNGYSLSENEEDELAYSCRIAKRDPSADMRSYMTLSKPVEEKLANGNYTHEELTTGLPALEQSINAYIDKYNTPEKIYRAYLGLADALNICKNEAELAISMDLNQEQLNEMQDKINSLQEYMRNGEFTTKAIDKLKNEGIKIPDELNEKINKTKQDAYNKFRIQAGKLRGKKEVSKEDAERYINEFNKDILRIQNEIITDYENIILEESLFIHTELENRYTESIKKFFSISLNIDSFKERMETDNNACNISLRKLNADEFKIIEKRDIITEKKIKSALFYVGVGIASLPLSLPVAIAGSILTSIAGDYIHKIIPKDKIQGVDFLEYSNKELKNVENQFNIFIQNKEDERKRHTGSLLDSYVREIEERTNDYFNNLKAQQDELRKNKDLYEIERKKAELKIDEVNVYLSRLINIIEV